MRDFLDRYTELERRVNRLETEPREAGGGGFTFGLGAWTDLLVHNETDRFGYDSRIAQHPYNPAQIALGNDGKAYLRGFLMWNSNNVAGPKPGASNDPAYARNVRAALVPPGSEPDPNGQGWYGLCPMTVVSPADWAPTGIAKVFVPWGPTPSDVVIEDFFSSDHPTLDFQATISFHDISWIL